ncbi:MAG TPA: phosphonate ABC transporter, permease protein PhnE [Bryobacteraceae bacterium]|nr:phosphonate ABC transporter, permease protein PhnE [Bryobacteraceae bacterium]
MNILGQFFPPYFSLHYLGAMMTPIGETLEMAAGGIFIAILAGLMAGTWAGAGLPGGRIIYRLLAAFRSIPDLTMAIFCVVMVGIGPAAGTLALAIFYSAAMGKIFADLFLAAPKEPVDALRATGAARLSVAMFGLLPLRSKDVLSYGFYEFESALRASVIVGAVGGGGIGTELVGTLNALDYRRTTTLILLLIVLVALVDQAAGLLKRRPLAVMVLLPIGAAAFWMNRPAMLAMSHAFGTFARMLPPELPSDAIGQLPRLFGETLEIALGGTLIGMTAAVPLGLLAARNLAPAWISLPVRRFLEALRAIPEVVWGLVLVTTIGIGPKAGVLALAFHATGALGRLYAESFENIPAAPVRALEATGAPRVAVAAMGFLPLALGPLAVHTLFRFEWNVRAATIVGVIGAGGIGQALYNAQQLFFYRQMMAYVLLTWMLVTIVDLASGTLRRRMKVMEVFA